MIVPDAPHITPAALETHKTMQEQAHAAELACLKERLAGRGVVALLEEYRLIAYDLGDWVRKELAKGGLCDPPPWAPTLEDVEQLLQQLELLTKLDNEMETAPPPGSPATDEA